MECPVKSCSCDRSTKAAQVQAELQTQLDALKPPPSSTASFKAAPAPTRTDVSGTAIDVEYSSSRCL
jgi:hypothetical protein